MSRQVCICTLGEMGYVVKLEGVGDHWDLKLLVGACGEIRGVCCENQ
jgi:hypothetical protein